MLVLLSVSGEMEWALPGWCGCGCVTVECASIAGVLVVPLFSRPFFSVVRASLLLLLLLLCGLCFFVFVFFVPARGCVCLCCGVVGVVATTRFQSIAYLLTDYSVLKNLCFETHRKRARKNSFITVLGN